MTEALAQTVLQMGMTNYQPLRIRSYAVRTFPLRTLYRRYARYSYANSVTRFIRRQYTYDVAPF